MKVEGLNHVNIVADDLDRTIAFYETVLGMKAREIPVAPPGFGGRWIYDENDQPIVHVQQYDAQRHGPADARRRTTGAIDHVALTCTGFAAMIERCRRMGLDYRVNDRQVGNLRQIFITDPDNVRLELNFPGD